MIAIIDYDAGNIKSVEKAFGFLGEDCVLTRDPSVILSADRVVFPGVGSYGSAMDNLKKYELPSVIKEAIESGKPFLGICLGYQLLFSGSEEDGGVEGLGILEGDVRRFPTGSGYKIPQIGWNSLSVKEGTKLFHGIAQETFVYFVHSYFVTCKDRRAVAATTEYVCSFDSAIEKDNIFGCQFHPEKSSSEGLKILKNFCG